jgi:glycosyltransferase involved in cell wall biosynthesis
VIIHSMTPARSRYQRLARRMSVAKDATNLEPDILHVHEPELLGSVISHARSRPVIYDVHESYLDVLKEREWIPRWMRPLVIAAWGGRERQLVRRCAGIIAVTGRIAQRYRSMDGLVEVVSNYPECQNFETLPKVVRDGRTCVFAGGLRPDRGLDQVMTSLSILKGRGVIVTLELAGPPDSDSYLKGLFTRAESLGIRSQMSYHGVLSKTQTVEFQYRGSIGLVPYLPVRNSMMGLPNKLLECMSLGLPVVYSDFPNYREIAETSGAGLAVDPTSPKAIADALERLVRDPGMAARMGEAGRQAVETKFNWAIERKKLLNLYRQILGN